MNRQLIWNMKGYLWIKLKALKPQQRKLFGNAVHINVFLADSKHYIPVMLMSTTGNPRDFTVTGTLQKNYISITEHLIWDTLNIKWSSVMLKVGNDETTLPDLVTVPLMDKYRVRSIMDITSLVSYIFLLTGATQQAPHKCNTLPIQDINQSV